MIQILLKSNDSTGGFGYWLVDHDNPECFLKFKYILDDTRILFDSWGQMSAVGSSEKSEFPNFRFFLHSKGSIKGVQAGPPKNPKIVRFPFLHYTPVVNSKNPYGETYKT